MSHLEKYLEYLCTKEKDHRLIKYQEICVDMVKNLGDDRDLKAKIEQGMRMAERTGAYTGYLGVMKNHESILYSRYLMLVWELLGEIRKYSFRVQPVDTDVRYTIEKVQA